MSQTIYITHFENPNCFYFKFDHDLHDVALQCLEDEICKYARCKYSENTTNSWSECDIGDTVAAYETTWGKWVRAQVRNNLTDLECYQLWAVDHGKMFQTTYRNVIPLQGNLTNRQVKGVFRGSIYGVTPAKLEYDVATCKPELKRSTIWSQKAIDQCRKLFSGDNIVRICFDIKEQRKDYFFGNIYTQMLSRNSKKICSIHIGDALVSISQALTIDVDFQKEMNRIVMEFTTKCDTNANRSQSNAQKILEVQKENGNYIPQRPPSTVIASEIDGGKTRMKMRNIPTTSVANTGLTSEIDGQNTQKQMQSKSYAPSVAASTTVPSEIDGGRTKMQMNIKNYAPSVAASTTVPSEIDGGITRMRMKNPQSPRLMMCNGNNGNDFNRNNGRVYMPAGYEREISDFNKYNK